MADLLKKLGSVVSLEHDDGTDALACVHEVEALVDVLELEGVGDHRVDLDLAVHVLVDDLGNIGAAACAAKGGAHPRTPGDQLERARRDLLSGPRNPDHDRLAPAPVRSLQRLAHHLGIAGAVEGVVGTAIGELDDMVNDVLDLARID